MSSKWKIPTITAAFIVFLLYLNRPTSHLYQGSPRELLAQPSSTQDGGKFKWSEVPHKFPVTSMKPVPTNIQSIPKIQHKFEKETRKEKAVRFARRDAVKGNFTHAWAGYVNHAWLKDELQPISGESMNPFGGWAATLVDSLDTLWIMGMHNEFKIAVQAIQKIDFSTCALDLLNVFETTIRYLGGFLSAYDLSEGKYPILLQKATEMGDMLYKAFDTPNRLPILRWDFNAAAKGSSQEAGDNVLESEIGSLTLEFTRLSQITGDPKYYDAVQRITDVFDQQQSKSKLPEAGGFTIGGMADSLYEYFPKTDFPKQHLLLGGATQQYRRIYEYALIAMKRNIFYRPMLPNGEDIRFAGQVDSEGKTPVMDLKTSPEAQHLGCFAGGLVAIGAKIFENEEDLVLAKKLTEGCLWGYESMPLGIMPEIMHLVTCEDENHCLWDEKKWHDEVNQRNEGSETAKEKIEKHKLLPGVSKIDKAIESVFILYRITGDRSLLDRAWNMFNNIIKHTITEIGHAELEDCMVPNPKKADRMESFWMAETLKYFYLIFSEPDLISLDEYVLNTEAHPLKRPS
ncbi:class I alpha-mannosidase protein [Rutstroemia sp. NJR-2017a BBW]|nr:class I alpha-mannosidase protein [Rutstroemia sp. NJR-2017a BBW]